MAEARTPRSRRASSEEDGGSTAPRAADRPEKNRGWHEGTIWYDAAKGRYRGRVELGGQRVQASGESEREVRGKLAKARQRYEAGQRGSALSRASRETVASYLKGWLETKRHLRPGAWARLESSVRVYLVPALGRLKLADLEPDHLRRLYVRLHTEGGVERPGRPSRPLAARSVRNVHRAIYQALDRAERDGILQRNVARLVDDALPRPPAKRLRALATAEVHRFLEVATGQRLEPLFAVKAELGCRIGELLGLTWDCVDLGDSHDERLGQRGEASRVPAGAILIEQQLVPSPVRAPQFAQPKSPTGLRPVYLTRRAREALRRQRDRQAADRRRWQHDPRWRDFGLVFATKYGTPLLEQNVTRAFHRLAARAGLPADATPHWLRHTAGTRMAERGVEISAVAAVLGHADAGFTARTYLHALHDRRREAAARMDGAYDLDEPSPAGDPAAPPQGDGVGSEV
jgi:integrase